MEVYNYAVDPHGQGDPLSPAPRPGQFILDRWQVLQLVKDTAKVTGIGEREIAVLVAHLSVLGKGPIRSDQLLISYAQIAGILDRANCMDERRFRRGEARLEQLGLVRRNLSANGRRFPIRDGSGRIVNAYGLDLRPLFLRVPYLRVLEEEMRMEEARKNALRSRISARLSEIKRRSEAAAGGLTQELEDISVQTRNLLRRARTTLSEMEEAENWLEAKLSENAPEPEILQTQQASDGALSPVILAVDAGQNDRQVESPRKELNTFVYAEKACVSPSAIAWKSYGQVAMFFPERPSSMRDLQVLIYKFSGFIGLGQDSIENGLRLFEPQQMLRVLDYISKRIEQIARPNAYFKAMLQMYSVGEAIAGGKVRRGQPDELNYDRGHSLAVSVG